MCSGWRSSAAGGQVELLRSREVHLITLPNNVRKQTHLTFIRESEGSRLVAVVVVPEEHMEGDPTKLGW